MDLMACIGKQKLKTSINEWLQIRCLKWFAQGFASGHEDYRQHLGNEKEE